MQVIVPLNVFLFVYELPSLKMKLYLCFYFPNQPIVNFSFVSITYQSETPKDDFSCFPLMHNWSKHVFLIAMHARLKEIDLKNHWPYFKFHCNFIIILWPENHWPWISGHYSRSFCYWLYSPCFFLNNFLFFILIQQFTQLIFNLFVLPALNKWLWERPTCSSTQISYRVTHHQMGTVFIERTVP